ncbi:MAG: cobT [Caulobacteraceae bacterium]|nr:cobT [Caulobacteraceae bacterium]
MTWTPPEIATVDAELRQRLRAAVDGKAKPPGSLGRIEDLAVQLGTIQGRMDPKVGAATVLVFAGDHGLTEEGVSAYPSAVTAAMVGMFLAGRATVSAFAEPAGVDVRVIDVGVASDLPAHPKLISARVRAGTRNAAREPAMTTAECAEALEVGMAQARAAAAEGADVIALGEMGIGNSAAASLIMHRLAPAALSNCVGLGAGHDAAGMARKMAALELAAARSDAVQPFEVLRQFGGYEIAAMAGAALEAAALGRVVVVDGFIATAAVLAAIRMRPALIDYCVFAHISAEQGHRLMMASLQARPLLDLGLRLGEGTGAVLAVPLLRAAARLLTEVADLSEVMGPP